MTADPILPNGQIRSMLRLVDRHLHKCRHRQHRLISFLFKGGCIISIGFNFGVVHSETTAINHAWRSKDSLSGTTILVVRVRKDGTLGMSKPCDNCVAQLIDAGIRKVIYSNNDGMFQTMKLPSHTEVRVNSKLQNMIWHKKGA